MDTTGKPEESRPQLLRDLLDLRADGRLPRLRFAKCMAVWACAAALAVFAAFWQLSIGESPRAGTGLGVVVAWFAGSACVRRLHDIGRGGFWLVPVIALLPLGLTWLFAAESAPGENLWGENPKGMLKISDARLLSKLAREAKKGSAIDEIMGRDSGKAFDRGFSDEGKN